VRPESQQNPSAKVNFIRDIAPVAAIIRVPLVVVPQLINSVAPASNARGMTKFRALAALRLMIVPNLSGP
jgi:hypothetical protein